MAQIMKPFILDETGEKIVSAIGTLDTTCSENAKTIVDALTELITQLATINETLKTLKTTGSTDSTETPDSSGTTDSTGSTDSTEEGGTTA